MPVTPNLNLQTPIIGSNNWGGPLNFNFSQLDRFLSGGLSIPGLSVAGNIVVTGSVTAGSFVGLSGTFLTSALFNVANGIPQLNAAGLIPTSLLASQGIVVVAYSASAIFNGALGGAFKMTLTGDVTSPTFINGGVGPSIVTFRLIQDGTGNRAFAWPANVRNGGAINPAAGSTSIQSFLLDTDGSLDALTAMAYS